MWIKGHQPSKRIRVIILWDYKRAKEFNNGLLQLEE